MASEPSPAFLFYVKDWRSSRKVRGMTFAERAMYLEMLIEQWDVGSAPGSPAACAAELGGTVDEWRAAWPKLKENFSAKTRHHRAVSRGRVINLKLDGLRLERQRYLKAQQESGLRGANARWKAHGKPIATPMATPMAKNGLRSDLISSDLISSDLISPTQTENPESPPKLASRKQAPPNGTGLRDRFDAFWQAYPRKAGKEAAWKAWEKCRPTAELTAVMLTALQWQSQQDDWLRDGGRFVPHPATWLNRGQWQDEPSTTPRLSDKTLAVGRAVQEFLK